jgi:hypothetical protein
MEPLSAADELLDRRIRLADALRRKASALGRANVCLSGTTEQEMQQRSDNSAEVALLRLKLNQVITNGFNWPGDALVNDLVSNSNALALESELCADKTVIIRNCRLLIALVPASSV